MWFTEEEMKNEEWRDIPFFEGFYQASSLSRVKSLERTIKNSLGISFLLKGTIIKQSLNNRGRRVVYISKNHHNYCFRVHSLVVSAWYGPRPKGMECRHKDGNKLNNRPENLKWGTREENDKDKIEHGQVPHGEGHWSAKFKKETIKKMIELYQTGDYFQREIAEMFGTKQPYISQIVNRKSWKIL